MGSAGGERREAGGCWAMRDLDYGGGAGVGGWVKGDGVANCFYALDLIDYLLPKRGRMLFIRRRISLYYESRPSIIFVFSPFIFTPRILFHNFNL
jgi:hypothetical protein